LRDAAVLFAELYRGRTDLRGTEDGGCLQDLGRRRLLLQGLAYLRVGLREGLVLLLQLSKEARPTMNGREAL
jgi:hypothetical protein